MKNTGKLALTALLGAAALSTVAAAPVVTGADVNQGITAYYDAEGIDARTPSQNGSTTLGDAIQGGFYGNAANLRKSGHGVVPSRTPGPEKCDRDAETDLCTGTVEGSTWGAYRNADTTDDFWEGGLNPSNLR